MRIVAIDPDCAKSGVAVYDTSTRTLEATCLTFPRLLECLMLDSGGDDPPVVIVEAGWQSASNWHLMGHDTRAVAAHKGYSVGRNHQTGMLIVEWCRDAGIEVYEVKPLAKHWSGKDRKITQAELERLTGIKGRMNQDARDAALLCWEYRTRLPYLRAVAKKIL